MFSEDGGNESDASKEEIEEEEAGSESSGAEESEHTEQIFALLQRGLGNHGEGGGSTSPELLEGSTNSSHNDEEENVVEVSAEGFRLATDTMGKIDLIRNFLRPGNFTEAWEGVSYIIPYVLPAAVNVQQANEINEFVTKTWVAVQRFPQGPQDLGEEYNRCVTKQWSLFEESAFQANIHGVKEPPREEPSPMQARTSFADAGIPKVLEERDEETISAWREQMPQRFLIILPSGCITVELKNPLRIPGNPVGGFICDMCNRNDVFVAYQAIHGDSRHNIMLYDHCQGYDACYACAVYYYAKAKQAVEMYHEQDVVKFCFPTVADTWEYPVRYYKLRRPHTEHCGIRIQSWKVEREQICTASSSFIVSLTATAAPRAAYLRAFVAKVASNSGTSTTNCWKTVPIVRQTTFYGVSEKDRLGDCAVCCEPMLREGDLELLQRKRDREDELTRVSSSMLSRLGSVDSVDALRNDAALLLQSKCGHIFHDTCIHDYVRTSCPSGLGINKWRGQAPCPVCRTEGFLPDEDLQAVLAGNQFRAEFRLSEEDVFRSALCKELFCRPQPQCPSLASPHCVVRLDVALACEEEVMLPTDLASGIKLCLPLTGPDSEWEAASS